MLVLRKPRPDRARALSRAEVEQLLSREGISLRERTFWRMAYEIAARSAELLALDVEDLDLPNRHAKVRRKGGAVDVIVWQTGTARLLPRLLRDRKSGPVFVTERKARVPLSAADLDEHGHAAQLPASRGAVLRGLRWRDPASAPALGSHSRCRGQHWSSHADGQERPHVRAVAGKYARVSAEALARHQLSAVCCLLSAVCSVAVCCLLLMLHVAQLMWDARLCCTWSDEKERHERADVPTARSELLPGYFDPVVRRNW